ncbi:MAG TPA: hypothetical protein VL752_06210 [Acidisoma sp.]|uniref:hypothetical protein n=1 Tax=Acidisoma sp. TaxID=1872115 RepID=UPI002C10AC9D|nr:hypothetical protein [Acidisoma sp.]HTI00524.1 hypothetical protein [Acidisoma sp.]
MARGTARGNEKRSGPAQAACQDDTIGEHAGEPGIMQKAENTDAAPREIRFAPCVVVSSLKPGVPRRI